MAALREPGEDEPIVDFSDSPSTGKNWCSRELRPEGIWCRALRASPTEKSGVLYETISCGVKVVREQTKKRGGEDWIDRLQERGVVRTEKELSMGAIDAWVQGSLRDHGELSLSGIAAGRRKIGWNRGPVAWAVGSYISAETETIVHARVVERNPDFDEETSAHFTNPNHGESPDLSMFMAVTADLALRHALLFNVQEVFRKVNNGRVSYKDAGIELLALDELYGSRGRPLIPARMWSAVTAEFALESRWIRLIQRFLVMRSV